MRALLPSLAALALAPAACDDTTAGTLPDDGKPPAIARLLVQDEQTDGTGAGNVTDLLDGDPERPCAVDDPCPQPFTIDQQPLPGCQFSDPLADNGYCPDPLHVGAVGIGIPGDVGGGTAIRLVFTKPLAIDALPDGAVRLLDATMAEVPSVTYWDPSGSPDQTFDPLLAPFGPALVLKPKAPLLPEAEYGLLVDTSILVDRRMRAATAPDGKPLPNPFVQDIRTQALALVAATPDVTVTMPAPTTLRPDDVIQLRFNMDVDEKSARVALFGPNGNFSVEAWTDRGDDPMNCSTAIRRTLDLVALDGFGSPTDLDEGDYTLVVDKLADATGRSTLPMRTFHFAVKGPKAADDPQAVGNFVLPEACVAAGVDGGSDAGVGDM